MIYWHEWNLERVNYNELLGRIINIASEINLCIKTPHSSFVKADI